VTRWVGLVAALALAAAGVGALLLAVDVHRWRGQVAAGDVAYRTDPRAAKWKPTQLLGGVAEGLLGVQDDLAARQGYLAFKLGQPRKLYFVAGDQIVAYRSSAQALLARISDGDHDTSRRAQELNMIGILELISFPGGDPNERQKHLPRAAADFRQAILLDPSNADAKTNLELTLRLMQNPNHRGGAQSGLGGTTAKGEETGSGY
jgi:hypothetical protein